MDPLSWLGLRKRQGAHPSLSALHGALRSLLPDDEPVVVRYTVVVAALLTRIAHADGVFLQCELDHMRDLFGHIDRLPPDGVDGFCATVNEHVPKMSEAEWDLCFQELKSLCDAAERRRVLRLLAEQATADGKIAEQEHGVLADIAQRLGIADHELSAVEDEVLARVPAAAAADTSATERVSEPREPG